MTMNHTRESFHNLFYYSGLDEKTYHSIEARLYDRNYKFLRDVCLFTMILGTIFLLLVFFKLTPRRMLIPYTYLTIISLVFFFLFHSPLSKTKKTGRILVSFYIYLLFFFTTLLGTKYSMPSSQAVFFNVLLVFLPILYIQTPSHAIFVIITNVLIFDFVAMQYKTGLTLVSDLTNTFIFGVLAIYCNFRITSKFVKQFAYEMRIEKEKNYDSLTKIMSKEYSEKMIRKKLESKEAGCLLIIDIDHFKQFNDNYGHIYGDEVLFKVAKGLRESFREDDIVGRFGGDEFIAFMHNAKMKDAKNKAELYRSRLKTLFEGKAPVTCSIGIAASDECYNYENLLKQADEALYYAKENGRNQVCVYSEKEEKS